MLEGKKVLSSEEKALRRELEDHFLLCPGVDFAGVAGAAEPGGKLVITLGTSRPRLVADMLGMYLPAAQSKLDGKNYRVAIVRGKTRTEG